MIEDVADLSSPALEATAPIVDAAGPDRRCRGPDRRCRSAPRAGPADARRRCDRPDCGTDRRDSGADRAGRTFDAGWSLPADIAGRRDRTVVGDSSRLSNRRMAFVFGKRLRSLVHPPLGRLAGNALSPNVFTTGSPTGIASGPGRVVTVGSDSLLASDAPSGPLPVPSAPSVPGVPGPVGTPGCPGHSGSGSGGSSSSQVAATTPFGPPSVLANAQFADGDLAAALLTRCEEPGSSPD